MLLCNIFYRIPEIFQDQADNLNLNDQIHLAKFFARIIIFAAVGMNKTHIFFFRLFFNVRILHRYFLRRLCHMLFGAVVNLAFDIRKYPQADLIARIFFLFVRLVGTVTQSTGFDVLLDLASRGK